jgi:hypothetical protein
MGDIADLLEYWLEEPPTHVILGWRYLERKPKQQINEEDAVRQMSELQGMMGTRAGSMPDHLKDMARWAEQQRGRLQSNKGRSEHVG